ncbi:Uncharacterized protein ABJ99_3550 [Pseudomonas syringae pv. cilantro]|uniref:Uncharacterized protein n=1 Tax=Pseudomonas syringae pv. cilantro TaxID=81035 RepID=A0A0N0XAR1_PSESX|nr:Uncharacterized protein ABJ99_3550 [Pseudomonas syringae pv. cilantro]
MPVDRQAAVLDRLLQPPVAALGDVQLVRVQQGLPATQFAGHRACVFRIIERHVPHLNPTLAQRLGKMTHGTEDQRDFLRMMRHMTRLLHHLDQQDRVVLGVQVLQGSEVEGELVAEDEMEAMGLGHEAESLSIKSA